MSCDVGEVTESLENELCRAQILWAMQHKRQGAWLRAEWPGFEPGFRRGGDFSSHLRVQTGRGVHSASYKISTGGLLGGKGGRA